MLQEYGGNGDQCLNLPTDVCRTHNPDDGTSYNSVSTVSLIQFHKTTNGNDHNKTGQA